MRNLKKDRIPCLIPQFLNLSRPQVLTESVSHLENQNLSLCIIGLNEAVKHLCDYELHESSTAFDLGKKILIEIFEICKNKSKNNSKKYSLLEDANNKVKYRFAKLDKKHFPKKSNPLVFRDRRSKSRAAYYRKHSSFTVPI